MIGHINWRSLADRRTDTRLVMLCKKQTYSYHQLDSRERAPSLSHTKYHPHAYKTVIILSANDTKLEQSPLNTVKSDC
jgi:hypothetical protein